MKLFYEKELGHVHVSTYGRAVDQSPNEQLSGETFNALLDFFPRGEDVHITWHKLPNANYPKGLREVVVTNNWVRRRGSKKNVSMNRSDGVVVMERNHAVAFTTADCPTTILSFDDPALPFAMLHCGRDSLHNIENEDLNDSVIRRTVLKLKEFGNPATLHAFIALGINPIHFPYGNYPDVIAKLAHWGKNVIPDRTRGTIDLFELIACQLEASGVKRKHVQSDGFDTFSHPQLASHRGFTAEKDRGETTFTKNGRNLVVAYRT